MYERELKCALSAARAAATVLRPEFHRGYRESLDVAVEQSLRHSLMQAYPDYGYCGEETAQVTPARDPRGHLWLVDPHDGTKAAAKGHRGAAISIALLRQGLPVLGVVFAYSAPDDQGDLFWWAEGLGPLHRNGREIQRTWSSTPNASMTALISQDADHAAAANAEVVYPMRYRGIPGIAYRLALVAAGEGDLAVSLNSPTGWDVAGGHALLLGAGGSLFGEEGRPVTYDASGSPLISLHTCFGGSAELVQSVALRDWRKALRHQDQKTGEALTYLEPGKNITDAGILARAQGCLLGQLAGDALGSLVEFEDERRIHSMYPDGPRLLQDGGTWHTIAGQPTDDSEMALALARAIVRQNNYNEEAAATAYARWYDSVPFDKGNTTCTALGPASNALRRGLPIAEAAHAHASAASQANGALMRISPMGIFGAALEPDRTAMFARMDAGITHPHEACRSANAVFAVAISYAIRTGSDAQDTYQFARAWASDGGVDPAILECLKAAESKPLRHTQSTMGWVRVAFQNAFYQLLHAATLEAGVVDTVRAGGDTDTNAAIAGALLGAVHGRSGIPKQWIDRVVTCRPIPKLQGVFQPRPAEYWPVDALQLAERLLLAGLNASGRDRFGPNSMWTGADQVDSTAYRLSNDEKSRIQQLAHFLPLIEVVDPSTQGLAFEWKTDSHCEITDRGSDTALEGFFSMSTKLLGQVDYDGFPVNDWLAQPDFLERAQLPQLRIVLTWMTRGERFCWGFWAGQLESGNLIRLIIRLLALAKDNGDLDPLIKMTKPEQVVAKTRVRRSAAMWVPKELGRMASRLKEGRRIHRITVRDLLRMFKAERRGLNNVDGIRAAFDTLGLVTDPDFQSVSIDGLMQVRLRETK